MTTEPLLSVVVVTRDDARTLQPILAALGEQGDAGRMEIVVVAPTEAAGTPQPSFTAPFAGVRVVAVGAIVSRGRAAAAGVRVAAAPVVALSENHCFPLEGWSQRLLEAHAVAGRVGVGPAVLNANPERARSRVIYAAGYGMYPPSDEAGPRDELPLHNSSFRRDAALAFGGRLDDLLADERRFWAELRASGGTLWFEPSCLKTHVNEGTWTLVLGLSWSGGRRYGGARSAQWPLPRRLAYAAASPLITVPVFRNIRRLREASLPADSGGLRDDLTTAVLAAVHAAGEAAAYLAGPVDVHPFVEDEEFMIRERIDDEPLHDARVAGWVAALDA